MSGDAPTCEFITDSEEGRGHTDEEVIENGVVRCEAEATRVVRPAGTDITLNPNAPRQKRAVCEDHGAYLVAGEEKPENARKWEYDAAPPEKVVEAE